MAHALSQPFLAESCLRRSPIGEATLIQAASLGDLEAFNSLVLRHQDRAYNLAYRILGDRASAEDATQDAFLLAYRHIHTFRTGPFYAWLYRIVTNVCYDTLRYQKRRPAFSLTGVDSDDDNAALDIPAPDDGPEAVVQRRELADVLQRHIGALPIDQRMALILSDVQGASDKEIADIMRSSIGTVKSRLSRARAKLRRSLSDTGWHRSSSLTQTTMGS